MDITNPVSPNSISPPQNPANTPSVPKNPLPSAPKPFRLPVGILIVLLIVAFLGGLLLSAWYFQFQLQKANEQAATAQNGEAKKTLIIGTDPSGPPMESLNEKGELMGYDVELGYRLANELGRKAEFKTMSWDPLFAALKNKEIDMIISSVTITDERKKLYAFSQPYINAGQVIVSRTDKPITSLAGLTGKKISVQKGTTNEKEAFKHTSANLVISTETFDEAAKLLAEGKSDAMISDLTLAKGFIDQYENLKITSDPFTNEYYGIVLRKEDIELLDEINHALNVLQVKGILTDLTQKWLQ
jgi:polar amino acid transport system substrate-binding protein